MGAADGVVLIKRSPSSKISGMIHSAVSDFAAHLADYERLQPTTIHNYTSYLTLFLTFLTPPRPAGP